MAKEFNKKLLLLSLKFAPWCLAFGYLLELILSCIGIYSVFLATLFGQSVFAIVIILLFSFSLGYCIWHRLPLYFIFTANIINIIDFYIGIPVTGKWMICIYLLLIGMFILVGCLIKNKTHVEKRNFKKNST